MGGGDLNSKKSWHPNTLKNQGRVWKAEQAVEQEKKRIQELQLERAQERDRTELNNLAKRTAGVADDNRLHWMYDKPDKKANNEDYLLGKAIDKNYDKTEKPEDFIPAVARRVVGSSMLSSADDTQVDLQRKLKEDPLLLVKERERAARAALLNNPLQRRKLTELLRKEQEQKQSKIKKKPKKKDNDLDNKLASKLNALGGDKGINLAELLASSSDSTSSSDEEKSKKKKAKIKKSEKSKKKRKEKLDSSGKSKKIKQLNSSHETDSGHDKKKKKKNSSKMKKDSKSRSKNKGDDKDDFFGIISLRKNIEKNVLERRKEKEYKDNEQTQDKYEKDSRYSRKEDRSPERRKKRDSEERKDRRREYSEGRQSGKRRNYSEERQSGKRRDYSEERHSGKRRDYSEERQSGRRREESEDRKHMKSTRYEYEQRSGKIINESEERKVKKSRLGSEERAAKLAAMMAAGAAREVERGRRVALQRASDAAEPGPRLPAARSEARALPDSLASRIHSNRHYIQRDSRHMNENFARR